MIRHVALLCCLALAALGAGTYTDTIQVTVTF